MKKTVISVYGFTVSYQAQSDQIPARIVRAESYEGPEFWPVPRYDDEPYLIPLRETTPTHSLRHFF